MENSLSFLSQESKEKINDIWEKEPRIKAVFLHGSAVKGKMRKDSDIDLALLLSFGAEISTLEKFQLSGQLELLLKYRIDLGILSNQNLVFSKEVIWNGTRIFDRNPSLTDAKVNLLLSIFPLFKQALIFSNWMGKK